MIFNINYCQLEPTHYNITSPHKNNRHEQKSLHIVPPTLPNCEKALIDPHRPESPLNPLTPANAHPSTHLQRPNPNPLSTKVNKSRAYRVCGRLLSSFG